MQDYKFDDVKHALIWATEVLRGKSFPRISNIYIKETPSLNDDVKQRAWSGWRENLPVDEEESVLLAMKVYRNVKDLSIEDQELVLMKYWGDYYDKNYLKGALQIKEVMRQRGKHIRLNYRFSLRQIGTIKDIHFRKIHKSLKRIEQELETKMVAKEMVYPPVDASKEQPLISKNRYTDWSVGECRNS
tara:strand:- start:172932 stop:173495 length:564 start_codon:yes stop_codon:yes gene_type:complete